MVRPHDLDDAIKDVNKVYNVCKAALDDLNKLQNDELFVPIVLAFNSKHVAKDVHDWIFENNIVARWQIFDFNIPDTELHFTITGYKFKNTEHAMAFKLMWHDNK